MCLRDLVARGKRSAPAEAARSGAGVGVGYHWASSRRYPQVPRLLVTTRYETYTPDDSRFTIHDSRFTIHDSRFTIHDSIPQTHNPPLAFFGDFAQGVVGVDGDGVLDYF